jgi:hypothetical protein
MPEAPTQKCWCHQAWCCLQDQALRVWNIQSKVCVAMLHGDGGHRNEILSVVKPV